jgi:ABC-type transport system involved in multi-copper enzyme maturation permease subunit
MSETQVKKSNPIFWILLGALSFFGTIFTFVLEVPHFRNTIDLKSFIILLGLAGAIFGGIIASVFSNKRNSSSERWQLVLVGVLFFSVWFFLLGHRYNRGVDSQNFPWVKAKILSYQAVYKTRMGFVPGNLPKPDAYRMNLEILDIPSEIDALKQNQTIKTETKSKFSNIENGDIVYFPIKKGKLGYFCIEPNLITSSVPNSN